MRGLAGVVKTEGNIRNGSMIGLAATLGSADYVNGDGPKVGRAHAYARIARLFFRQTVDLGGGRI